MECGRDTALNYGFNLTELDFDGRKVVRLATMNPTTGESWEQGEWPVSL